MRRLLALLFNPASKRTVAVGGCPTYPNPVIPRGGDARPLVLRSLGIGQGTSGFARECPPGTTPRFIGGRHQCAPLVEYVPPPLPVAGPCPPGTVARRKAIPGGGFKQVCVPVIERPRPRRGSGIARAVLMGARPQEIWQPETGRGWTLQRGLTL